MTDEVWRRDEPSSPCVKICQIHPQAQLCLGCYRSPREISVWRHLSEAERQEIMAELPERAATLPRGRRRRRRG